MREVLVRLVGSRDAADDPALAGIIEDAKRYVQLERNTTRGATQVIFDGPSLRAAVAAAGRSVWDPDRPLVWVVLPALAGGSHRRTACATQYRGASAWPADRTGLGRQRRAGRRPGAAAPPQCLPRRIVPAPGAA